MHKHNSESEFPTQTLDSCTELDIADCGNQNMAVCVYDSPHLATCFSVLTANTTDQSTAEYWPALVRNGSFGVFWGLDLLKDPSTDRNVGSRPG